MSGLSCQSRPPKIRCCWKPAFHTGLLTVLLHLAAGGAAGCDVPDWCCCVYFCASGGIGMPTYPNLALSSLLSDCELWPQPDASSIPSSPAAKNRIAAGNCFVMIFSC